MQIECVCIKQRKFDKRWIADEILGSSTERSGRSHYESGDSSREA